MAGEMRTFQFAITTKDSEHMPSDFVALAKEHWHVSPHDLAIEMLVEVMHEAGAEFVRQHLDLFASELDVSGPVREEA